MARDLDPFKLSSPRIFLVRMMVFLILCGLVVTVLHKQIVVAFLANPGLNALIIAVLVIGILLAFRQVIRLFAEVAWVNGFRLADPGLAVARPPVLLVPMATILGERAGRTAISPTTMRGLMDSIATRLDEARDISRYMTSLLLFLGLLGTFWGLIETVESVGNVIQNLKVGGEAGAVFDSLREGLAAPLSGMGISFSSSLFGLAGSLALGFLDLQAGQAQNRFYMELEDWLSTIVSDLTLDGDARPVMTGAPSGEMRSAQLAQLTEMLSLEKIGKANIEDTLAALRANLATSESERDRLKGLYDGLQAGSGKANELAGQLDTQKSLTSRAMAQVELLNQ